MATYVIGDIHGGYKSLVQVIERAPLNKGDTIVFLGDYVDGWSQTKEVINYLIELKDKYDCVFIRGNHDQWFIDYINGNKNHAFPGWFNQGGQATLLSYGMDYHERLMSDYLVNNVNIPNEHIEFFNKTKPYYIDPSGNLFVHGGFNRHFHIDDEIHNNPNIFMWDRDLWQSALSYNSGQGYPFKMKDKFHEVFIGHTSTVMWGKTEPMNAANIWNLDTGAGFSGKLTIMNVDTKEYWQSDFVKELYPDEKGR